MTKPNKSLPSLLLITGASGTGKTTLLDAMAFELSHQSAAHTIYHHFDDLGVPSLADMIKDYGSTEAWQEMATKKWLNKIADGADKANKTDSSYGVPAQSGLDLIVLEGQMKPTVIIPTLQELGFTKKNYNIVLLDCYFITRQKRLLERGQPAFSSPKMDLFASYLRVQAAALGLPVIDTTNSNLSKNLAEISTIADNLRLGATNFQEISGY